MSCQSLVDEKHGSRYARTLPAWPKPAGQIVPETRPAGVHRPLSVDAGRQPVGLSWMTENEHCGGESRVSDQCQLLVLRPLRWRSFNVTV